MEGLYFFIASVISAMMIIPSLFIVGLEVWVNATYRRESFPSVSLVSRTCFIGVGCMYLHLSPGIAILADDFAPLSLAISAMLASNMILFDWISIKNSLETRARH